MTIYVTIQCDVCGAEESDDGVRWTIARWRADGGTFTPKRAVCAECREDPDEQQELEAARSRLDARRLGDAEEPQEGTR